MNAAVAAVVGGKLAEVVLHCFAFLLATLLNEIRSGTLHFLSVRQSSLPPNHFPTQTHRRIVNGRHLHIIYPRRNTLLRNGIVEQ